MNFKFTLEIKLNHYPQTNYAAGKLIHSMLFDAINLADFRDYFSRQECAASVCLCSRFMSLCGSNRFRKKLESKAKLKTQNLNPQTYDKYCTNT